jgi:cell wall-associated NlpC family hydrolase
MRRALLIAFLAALAAPGAARAETAVVDVSVATLWKAPNLARSLDAPSLGNPVDPRAWDRNLATTADRIWLDSHVQTQALYGQEVTILQRRGAWVKIAITDEPDPQDPHGYPGWLPAKQLVHPREIAQEEPRAIVTAPSGWLRDMKGRRLVELSFATQLSFVRSKGKDVVVRSARGDEALLARVQVRLQDVAHHPSGAEVVAVAERFLGIRYLWGGLSVFGYDCSGLVWAVYRSYGLTIPRDADPQFRDGAPVAKAKLRPGDLLFYGTQRYVHHVAIYAGSGRMVEAPDSAHRVRLVPVRWREFAGARRY